MIERSCAFFDRDGVINVKQPEGEYVTAWSDFVFIPAAIDWIRIFNTLNYLVIIVTNQRGIAKGLMSISDLENIHHKMTQALSSYGAIVNDIFYCPHESDSCNCRKPKPGMVLSAQAKWNVNLKESILIGDSPSDRQLAINCGLRFIGAKEGRLVDRI